MKEIQFICGGGAELFKKVLNGKKREDVLASSFLASAIEELRGEADRFLDRKIPVLPFSLFKQFDTSGDRKQFEALYFERRKRFTALALAAWLWEKQEYIAALEDII
jgi:sigma54-dependent transcription regulator